MSLDDIEDSLKVIVVGDGNVGKTSMLRRYVKGTYTEQYKKTIGAEYLEKEVFVKDRNQSVTLMLWDTAGQEVFNALTSAYYRGAAAAVFAFSTIDRDSFMNVAKWRQKVEAQCGTSIVMVMVQTKFDLMNEAAVSKEEAEGLAAKMKIPFFRVSTKDDFNVTQLFDFVANECLKAGVSGDNGLQVIGGGNGAAASRPSEKEDETKDGDKKDKKDKKKDKEGDKDKDEEAELKKGEKDGDKDKKDKDKKDKKDKDKKDKDKKDKKGDKDDDKKDDGKAKPVSLKDGDKKKDKKEKKSGGCSLL